MFRKQRGLLVKLQYSGLIDKWVPFERHGSIRCCFPPAASSSNTNTTEEVFKISNTRAFETLLPTELRYRLQGAKVSFLGDTETREASEIIVDLKALSESSARRHQNKEGNKGEGNIDGEALPKTVGATSADYYYNTHQIPPVVGIKDLRGEGTTSKNDKLNKTHKEQLFEKYNISKPSFLAEETPQVAEERGKTPDEDGKEKEQGTGKMETTNEKEKGGPEVVGCAGIKGYISAWSNLQRTGILTPLYAIKTEEGEYQVDESEKQECRKKLMDYLGGKEDQGEALPECFVIPNVDAFDSAMPTALGVKGSYVEFTALQLPSVEHHYQGFGCFLAVNIQVIKTVSQIERERGGRQGKKDGKDNTSSSSHSKVERRVLHGVVSRWSGGQGVIEATDSQLYFIESMHDFFLLDPTAVAIQGAVVQFEVEQGDADEDSQSSPMSQSASKPITFKQGTFTQSEAALKETAEKRRKKMGANLQVTEGAYAKNIKILSEISTATLKGEKGFAQANPLPLVKNQKQMAQNVMAGNEDTPQQETEEEQASWTWKTGRLALWSKTEKQGVIAGADGERYLLRNAKVDAKEPSAFIEEAGVGKLLHFALKPNSKLAKVVHFVVDEETKAQPQTVQPIRDGDYLHYPTPAEQHLDTVKLVPSDDGKRMGTSYEQHSTLPRIGRSKQGLSCIDGSGPSNLTAEEAKARIQRQSEIARSGQDASAQMQENGSIDSDAASVSPLATNYWSNRFDNVGAKMTEYNKFKDNLVPPELDNIIEGFDDDPWLKDGSKNKTAHGNTKYSDICNISSQGLLKLGVTMQSPTKRDELIKKTEDRLPPEIREKALNRAREAAPRYIKAIKEAQDKGQEPNFSFF